MLAPQKINIYFFLAIVIVIGMLSGCGSPVTVPHTPDEPSNPPEATTPLPDESPKPPDRIDILYFYRSNPCDCMAEVGDNIKYTVETYFQNELSSGRLTFNMVVSDDEANTDIVKKYNSPPFGLFINTVQDKTERIYPVEGIWDLMNDGQKLIEFVNSTIEKSLNGEL